ncbi:MAG: ABC transporter ATP-binding protein [Propionibacteriales bacterium]|nr:ABC transporter ATP-binding protein [Propionibacteriales bacterium]
MTATRIDPTASVHDVWVSYQAGKGVGSTHALRGVSTTVYPGEFISVVGPSGSGKSSLLHALAGFARPVDGQVMLLGTDITRARQAAIARVHRRGVGVIFQSLNLVPSLPIIENVLLPSRFARSRIDQGRAVGVLKQLGLGDRLGHRTSTLSGGEQQRVALARILYAPPTIVLADEPTGALDTASTGLVLEQFRLLARSGTSVVLVTHDLQAGVQADRALVMRDGQLVREIHQPTTQQLVESAPAPTTSEAVHDG